MRKLHKQCFIAVLFASGAFATSEVSGTPLLVAQAQSIGLSIVDQDIDTRTSGTAFADLIDARTASRAVAQFGTLRALGQAVDVPPVPSHSTSAAAAASWADDVTLDAAGLMGQVGTATVQYRIDGSMSFDSAASARSNYSFFVRRGQLFDNVSVGNWEIGVGASGADFMNRTISATFPIVFGAERQWTFTISLQSTVFGIVQDASALVDMSDTALWLGISEVRDAAGSLVSTYGVTSTSGTDWSQSVLQAVPEQPVPEPSALLLFCVGALAIFGVALRTRNEHA